MVTILVHFGQFSCIFVQFGAPHVGPHDPSMTGFDSYTLSSVHLLWEWITFVTQDKFKTLCSVMIWRPFWCLLVHFGALRGPPHDPSVSKFHQVIKIMYPTHQEFISVTNPTFLDQDILIQQGPFPWVKVEKSYHHLPCRLEGGGSDGME